MMKIHQYLAFVLVGALGAVAAQADTIDFSSLSHGDIVNTQFTGVEISVVNVGGGPDLGVIFDSTLLGTADSDLEDPWTGGNLASTTVLGNILIIQEHGVDIGGVISTTPDDEGSRAAGSIHFDFDHAIDSFGFDLIDVEGPAEIGNDSGYFATFFDMNGAELARVGFGDFVDAGSAFFDSTVAYGNNSANRISPITATALGIGAFGSVEINLGGSAAVDNITYTTVVPLPSAFSLGSGCSVGWAAYLAGENDDWR